jgi:DNA-binding transcriptional MerR regulator
MSNYMTINQVANALGVSTKTLRRWEISKFLVPDERQEKTNIRLYHPIRIEYWKKMLDFDRTLKKHIRDLDTVRNELNKHMLEQDYKPGQPLILITPEQEQKFIKAHDDMDKWEVEYKRLMKEFLLFPSIMRKAILDYKEGKT